MDNATYDYLHECVVEETEMSLHEAVENLDGRVKDLETAE